MRINCHALLILLLASCVASAAGPVVRVVGPDPVAGEVVRLLAQRLPSLSVNRDGAPAQLVVAVGAGAFLGAVDAQTANVDAAPVAGIALTRHAYRQARPGRHTALYWDPDPVVQLRLARALLPGARRAGVLLGAVDEPLVSALRAESARLGMELSVATVDGEARLSRQLNRVLADSDFLLGIDDPQVFSPQSAKTVLLTSYRHAKPVFGPTAAWVDAGSVASLASGLADVVDELAAWMPRLLAEGGPPAPRYLTDYRVATNPSVARSLQLSLPSVPALEAQLHGKESPP